MIAWLLYALLVSSLLGLAAWLGETALRRAGGPTRWVWPLAMATSVVLPLLTHLGLVPSQGIAVLPAVLVGGGAAAGVPAVLPVLQAVGPAWGRLVVWLWATASLVLLARILVAALRLRGVRRSWRPAVLHGVKVRVSESDGPAVVWWLRAEIVVPQWALAMEPAMQRLMLRHEVEHVRSRDPALLLGSLLLAMAMPWNLPLWWQLRRLRLAVEADCDARVLRRGADARAYGSLLLEVGRSARIRRLAAAAFAEPATSLERRIHRLTDALRAPRRRQALGLAVAAAALLGLAMCAREPTPPKSSQPAATLASKGDITAGPVFTPFTVAPRLKNLAEVKHALEQDYPPLLKDAGIGGTVMVWFFIDAQGRVAQARIKGSSGQAPLDSAALHVARMMLFDPALNRSTPVSVWVALPIVFRPADRSVKDSLRAASDALDRAAKKALVGTRVTGSGPSGAATPSASGPAGQPPDSTYTLSITRLVRPPGQGPHSAAALMAGPSFTPYTKAPQLTNRRTTNKAMLDFYPPLLRDAGIGGTVMVWMLIDEQGRVVKTQLAEESGHPALDQAALRVANGMQFTGAELHGQLTAVWVNVPFVFKPDRQEKPRG